MENALTIISRDIYKDLRQLEKSHQVISDGVGCLVKTYKLECQYTDDYLFTILRQGKHTRSSYSSRDDRQAIGSFIVYSKIAENATI